MQVLLILTILSSTTIFDTTPPDDPPFHGLPARVVVANYAYFTKPAPPGVTALRACAIII